MQFHYDIYDLKQVIKPYKTNLNKKRIGTREDGGYVISEIPGLTYDAIYSYGSNDQTTFEREMYANYGTQSWVYDHTIDGLTNKPDYINFIKEGLRSDTFNWCVNGVPLPKEPTDTIENHIIKNGHQNYKNLFLQMDVEGSEWEALYVTPDSVLKQFAQMVIEFHARVSIPAMTAVYEKLNKHFIVTHIHGNNHDQCPWIDINFPKAIEVTLVRKDLVETSEIDMGEFPDKNLDSPNWTMFPDLTLDWWKHDYKGLK